MTRPSAITRWSLAPVCLLAISLTGVPVVFAGCPPGESNPISSGTGAVGVPVIFSGLGTDRHASFFILGAGDSANSGTLPDSWLVPVEDVDGDGVPEVRIEAPGDGPGGWGDPLTEGCPSTLMPPRPPLVIVLHHANEDLDGDGRFDVFEDTLIRNGSLDEFDIDADGIAQCGQPSGGVKNFESEDRDCDRRLTPPPNFGQYVPDCEGRNREDRDCDGHLDNINEDFNSNGRLDFGEDLDGDGRLDRGIEDRNGNNRLDDRPFPDPADPRNPLCQDPSNRNPVDPSIPCSIPHTLPPGVASALYPYGTLVPSPGGIIVASVEWNGSAYDFDAINTPTRLVTLADGRMFRLVEPTPLERLLGRASAGRATSCTFEIASRAHFEVDGVDLHDDRHGTREIFDHYAATLADGYFGGGPLPTFPTAGNGAGGTSFSFIRRLMPPSPPLVGSLRSEGSNAFLIRPLVLPFLRTVDSFDVDGDRFETPLDLCPLTPDGFCSIPHFSVICDADDDGIGDACDPSLDPDANVDSAWIEMPLGDPGVRDGAAAVYDSDRAVMVLFGGSSDTGTWEYDGASWRQVITPTAPPPRRDHRMVFDSTRGRVLLFGGRALSHQTLGDFWQYDGVDWIRIDVAESPAPRALFGFAYDSFRDMIVLFGGSSDGTDLGDTWEFDGTLWRRAPTPLSPNPANEVLMAFDSSRGVTVLRGAYSDSAAASQGGHQIFEFDGSTWQIVDYQGEFLPSSGGAMTFDPGRRQILLVGAWEARISPPSTGLYIPSSATRLYDGITWSALPTRDTPRDISDQPTAFDADRGVFILYRETDPVDGQPDTLELHRPDDTDGDGVPDPDDNCPLRVNPAQSDRDDDETGDLCDNCPDDDNPRQRDVDRDGSGDACDDDIDNDGLLNDDDICPAVFIPVPPVFAGCALSGAGNQDRDGDGVGDDCDRCPDDPGNDQDDDGVCDDIDNCLATFNPSQADGNEDGSGDACQPTLVIESIREDGGDNLEVQAIAEDPQDDPLSGTIEIFGSELIAIPETQTAGFDCGSGYFPEGVVGEGLGYWYRNASELYLIDLAGFLTHCNDGYPDYEFAMGKCNPFQSYFNTVLELTGLVPPFDLCVREFNDFGGGDTYTILELDPGSLQASMLRTTPSLSVPFAAGLPRQTDISSLGASGNHLLSITLTDGTTVPVSSEKEFFYQGETTMLIGSGVPRASICSPPAVLDCNGPLVGIVDSLDGGCSVDGGFGDPIVSYEWFRDFGRPGEQFLGGGPFLIDLTLPLGANALALRVTDSAGASDTVETTITVIDDDPPTLTVMPAPSQLWPPNHRMVPVDVDFMVNDLCDPNPSVSLLSVTSSEPDDAPGGPDGSTFGDIDGTESGTADSEILLRAERSGNGPGRVYELRYQASDLSGNVTPVPAVAMVIVPHDQGSSSEPLQLRMEPNGSPGMAHLYWPVIGGATGYDVIATDLADLRIVESRLSLGTVRVLARETTVAATDEGASGLIPALGNAVLYVIQMRDGHGGTGYGTATAPWPRMPDSCDSGCP